MRHDLNRVRCIRRLAAQAAVVGLIGFVFLLTSACGANQPPSVADEAGLRREAAEWDALFNAGRLTDLAAKYAADTVSMPFNAPTINGRQALQADFETFFGENDRPHHETSVDEVLMSSEWAIERAHYTMTYTPKAGGKSVIETGRHVMCRKRVDGRWQIAWEIFNTDEPAK